MRTLRFIVDNKTIKQDPECDFAGLFPGKNSNVRAEFSFSSDWENTVKVVAFWSMLDIEYEPQELKDGKSCSIPAEALSRASFKIQVFGKDNNGKISTNKLTIRQSGGSR